MQESLEIKLDTDEVVKKERDYTTFPFYHQLLDCQSCQCRQEATRVVAGVGPSDAKIIFVGRNPGSEEDKVAQPFVGKGGKLLDKMLEALDLDRSKVGITNIVKCYTAGDRPPAPIEIETCTKLWLLKELECFSQAKIIFPLGHQAIQVFLGPQAMSPAKEEGYWASIKMGDRQFYVCPLNHPGYLLRARGMQTKMFDSTLPRVKERLMKDWALSYELSRA